MSAIYEDLDMNFSLLESMMDQLEEKLGELENALLFLDFIAAGGLSRVGEAADYDRTGQPDFGETE